MGKNKAKKRQDEHGVWFDDVELNPNNYVPVSGSGYKVIDIRAECGYRKEHELYDQLSRLYSGALGVRGPIDLFDDQNKNQKIWRKIGDQVKQSIETLAGEKTDVKVLQQLNQVLYRATMAMNNPEDIDNINQLNILAKELPGRVPAKIKYPAVTLSGLIMAFCVVSIIVGVLAAVPTAGGSLLIAAGIWA